MPAPTWEGASTVDAYNRLPKSEDLISYGARYGRPWGQFHQSVQDVLLSADKEDRAEKSKARVSELVMKYNNPADPDFQGLSPSQRALKLSRLLLPLDPEMSKRYETASQTLQTRETTQSDLQKEKEAERKQQTSLKEMELTSEEKRKTDELANKLALEAMKSGDPAEEIKQLTYTISSLGDTEVDNAIKVNLRARLRVLASNKWLPKSTVTVTTEKTPEVDAPAPTPESMDLGTPEQVSMFNAAKSQITGQGAKPTTDHLNFLFNQGKITRDGLKSLVNLLAEPAGPVPTATGEKGAKGGNSGNAIEKEINSLKKETAKGSNAVAVANIRKSMDSAVANSTMDKAEYNRLDAILKAKEKEMSYVPPQKVLTDDEKLSSVVERYNEAGKQTLSNDIVTITKYNAAMKDIDNGLWIPAIAKLTKAIMQEAVNESDVQNNLLKGDIPEAVKSLPGVGKLAAALDRKDYESAAKSTIPGAASMVKGVIKKMNTFPELKDNPDFRELFVNRYFGVNPDSLPRLDYSPSGSNTPVEKPAEDFKMIQGKKILKGHEFNDNSGVRWVYVGKDAKPPFRKVK